MKIIIPALAAAFAAVVVWLVVRFVNRRERWAKWVLVAIAVPIIYVASFGPACWISSRAKIGRKAVVWLYYPIARHCAGLDDPNLERIRITVALYRYSTLFAADGWGWSERGTGVDSRGRLTGEPEWTRIQ
jgi:hypothetical protein